MAQPILIVDDDPALLRLLSATLSQHGYECLQAGSEAEALALLDSHAPDVVLMDLWLAGEENAAHNGLQLMQAVKAKDPEVECIILTGFATKDTAIQAINLGAYSYLTKPCEPSQLALTVQRALEKRATLCLLREEKDLLAQRIADRTNELEASNRELARAAKAKDEFLANMSHELRTPLTSILGLTETLLEQDYGPLNDKQLHYMHCIDESSRHLFYLINDILDLAKIEADRFDLLIEPVEVRQLCESSLRMVREAARKKKLTLSVAVAENLNTIQIDERRSKQILVNLLSNAVKFTPEQGEISLEAYLAEQNNWACFSVRDTGIGIASENILHLFNPFTQLDSGLSRQYAGTGLGLALVRKLTGLHGGKIMVCSAPGQGSRFTIFFPIHAPGATHGPVTSLAPITVSALSPAQQLD